MRIVILGAPGAGKGTQAKFIAEKFNIAHISTGDMLRSAIAKGTELGKEAKGYMDRGELDTLVLGLIRERLQEADCKNGFLLDGFPRNVSQAKALNALLEELKLSLTHILDFDVPESVLLERILNRAKEGSGRSDDNEEVVKNRLKVYNEQTLPVSNYYKEKGNFITVPAGTKSVEEVREIVLDLLK